MAEAFAAGALAPRAAKHVRPARRRRRTVMGNLTAAAPRSLVAQDPLAPEVGLVELAQLLGQAVALRRLSLGRRRAPQPPDNSATALDDPAQDREEGHGRDGQLLPGDPAPVGVEVHCSMHTHQTRGPQPDACVTRSANVSLGAAAQAKEDSVAKVSSAVDKVSYEDLYTRWEKGNWRAMEIDFSEDRKEWHEKWSETQRNAALWNYSLFLHGEDSVTDNLSPYIDAAPLEEQKYFLATQQVDEARHAI